MVFWIDLRVRFRPEDGSLWLSDDEGSVISLTITMKRLLLLLLEKRGSVLTRNELLECVWDAHGLRSSSHTLNKYISELRKHLAHLGIASECIITVPRVGFMFSNEIDVQVIENDPPEQPVTKTDLAQKQDLVGSEQNSEAFSKEKIYIPGFPSGFLILIGSLAISSMILLAGTHFSSQSVATNKRDLQRYFLFNFETCPVFTTQKNSPALSENKKKLFLDLVRNEKLSCLTGTSFLYQASESYVYGKKGRAFISRCTSLEDNYLSCFNFYWSGHESDAES